MPCTLRRHCLTKTNEILDQAAKVALHTNVAYEHNVIVHLVPSSGGLLAGPRIGIAKLDVEPVKKRIARLRFVTLFENLPRQLLEEQHAGATREHIASGQFFPRRASCEQRNNLLLRQGWLTAEDGLRGVSRAVDVNVNCVVPN